MHDHLAEAPGEPGVRSASGQGRQRVVYGRSRPTVEVPVADGPVCGEVLLKTLDPDGVWWARVAYVDPESYDTVVELLPVEALRPWP